MKIVEPKVYLIAETKVDHDALYEYLDDVHAGAFISDAPSDIEELTEVNGRLCYRSFLPGLNPNVSKVRNSNSDYLANVIAQNHGSVMEHGVVNFVFANVSRVFTHELVRHRVGTAISQESLRYVRFTELPVWIPSCFSNDPWALDKIDHIVTFLEEQAKDFSEYYNLDDPGVSFSVKKEITSAMRRFTAIEGVATTVGWSCNIRALKNILNLRTSSAAEEEMRVVFSKVGNLMVKKYPNLFMDHVDKSHEKNESPPMFISVNKHI